MFTLMSLGWKYFIATRGTVEHWNVFLPVCKIEIDVTVVVYQDVFFHRINKFIRATIIDRCFGNQWWRIWLIDTQFGTSFIVDIDVLETLYVIK